ncbi:hypothetical protein JTB14_014063 [Gonioctena quinquepunctata]|nr:hypothetical protein JTB14_014063 [Gonioctena quinquepunctata]
MDDLQKSSRKEAGENKSLPADFTWPEKFVERTSIAYSKISNNSSHNSQMEHDLKNARLDAIKEVRSRRSQSNDTNGKTTISTQQRNKVPHCLYPEVMVVDDKSSSSDHERSIWK